MSENNPKEIEELQSASFLKIKTGLIFLAILTLIFLLWALKVLDLSKVGLSLNLKSELPLIAPSKGPIKIIPENNKEKPFFVLPDSRVWTEIDDNKKNLSSKQEVKIKESIQNSSDNNIQNEHLEDDNSNKYSPTDKSEVFLNEDKPLETIKELENETIKNIGDISLSDSENNSLVEERIIVEDDKSSKSESLISNSIGNKNVRVQLASFKDKDVFPMRL